MSFDDRLTRRGSLARLGTLVGRRGRRRHLGRERRRQRPRRRVVRARHLRAHARADGRARTTSQARRCVATSPTAGPERRSALHLTVVDASTCKPISGAAVDIWHADAAGVYSGFGAGASSRTFMRGIQRTDARGLATLRDRLSGLVPGPHGAHPREGARRRQRRAHRPALLHRRAHRHGVQGDALLESRPNRTTRNADDSIFVNGGKRSLLALERRRQRLRRLDHDGRPPQLKV